MVVQVAPFGSYAANDITTGGAGELTIFKSNLDNIIALIPDPADTSPGLNTSPDFDSFKPSMAVQFRAELLALKAVAV